VWVGFLTNEFLLVQFDQGAVAVLEVLVARNPVKARVPLCLLCDFRSTKSEHPVAAYVVSASTALAQFGVMIGWNGEDSSRSNFQIVTQPMRQA
jgi:hypothetical protein